MRLDQKRIRNTKRLLKDISEQGNFFLASEISPAMKVKIANVEGWTDWNQHPYAFFPAPLYGKMSVRNAEGEYVEDRTKPKETAYRALEWELPNWGGSGVHSGVSEIPYQRFPRNFIPPVEIQLAISDDKSGNAYAIVDRHFKKDESDEKIAVFCSNLLLEIFGNVIAYSSTTNGVDIPAPTHFETVNWEILPKGDKIWDAINSNERKRLTKSEQSLLRERFDYIMARRPTNVYRGIGGYSGYFVFDFPIGHKGHYYIFDSIVYGMATYIFDGNWQEISKLTKKEILTQHIQIDRIIHNEAWAEKLRPYFA